MRPRILLVPTLTELEWAVRPLLEEWADVLSYDGPGVGDEPPAPGLRSPATAERGLARLDEAGWESCIVVGDELGSLAALLLARRRPRAVDALVLGHPLVSLDPRGERSGLNTAVVEAHLQLAGTSFRAFVREQFRSWTGLYGTPVADSDARAEEYLERVPHELATAFHAEILTQAGRYEEQIAAAFAEIGSLPTLLVCHEGCLMFTREGFEEALAALPHADSAATRQKPSVDPAFDGIVREFAQRHAG